MASHTAPHPNAELLESATKGFGYLFANDIDAAKTLFTGQDDPFHLMGLGVCAFLEAVLGMETNVVTEASRCLALSETASRKYAKNGVGAAKGKVYSRFPAGMEWEILNADAVVLLGLTNAISESYMGYLQCMYALNNAHSKFTKLYKTVFPAGLPEIESPSSSPTTSAPPTASLAPPQDLHHKSSVSSLASAASRLSSKSSDPTPGYLAATTPGTPTGALTPTSSVGKGFFSRWMGASNAAAAASEPALHSPSRGKKGHAGHPHETRGFEDGPVEELIVSGTAFGYGLFNLVFSLLPKKVQGLVGFLGFQHDRALALRALALSATKQDVHGVFSGLVLMTYYGVVLLLSGWQADEANLIKVYRGIVDNVELRYPEGALWILNRAKILRMANDPEAAIKVLQDGLKPKADGKKGFAQADMMLWFELAWLLLGQRRYEEAAAAFVKMTELNSWSHGTYYFIASGCHFAIGNMDKAQELLDTIPGLIDKKMGGKDLPTEVFIKKKLTFYKEKQARRGGDPARYVEAIKICPAEELAIFWNTHARIDVVTAKAHIATFAALTPKLTITSPEIEALASQNVDHEGVKQRRNSISSTKSKASAAVPAATSSGFLSGWTGSSVVASPSSTSVEKGGEVLDLDNGDEQAVRALLLGICHKTVESYEAAQAFLGEAVRLQDGGRVRVNTWVGGVAWFERGVAEIREVEWRQKRDSEGKGDAYWKGEWERALKGAGAKLEKAMALSPNSVDLSSRLDSRVSMLRDEIVAKRASLGIAGK
ncbi:mitochondrial outer membrane protein IML2 [Ephemerocybe angulata]|uniref:Mitochondrial outer membrane protein IML2 n=1 Tax=Ephemerocybe angulata TaxID=980116 RepID=A0A8H6HQ16_9AGAR|nr:mitochondrial outer membrane protein IML2 [Tulosesus angulatus]